MNVESYQLALVVGFTFGQLTYFAADRVIEWWQRRRERRRMTAIDRPAGMWRKVGSPVEEGSRLVVPERKRRDVIPPHPYRRNGR